MDRCYCSNPPFALLLLSFLCSYSGLLYGQAVSGTILGSVHDATGGAVAKAPLTITNTETGLSRTVESDSSGDYTAPSLPPGPYTVSVQMQGFKSISLSNLHLGVDQKLRADVTLQLG